MTSDILRRSRPEETCDGQQLPTGTGIWHDRGVLTSNGYVLDERPGRLGPLIPTPAVEREDRDALWHRLRTQGYLYLKGFLDPAVVLGFREYYFANLVRTGLVAPDAAPVLGIAGPGVDRARLREVLYETIVPGPEYEAFCTQPAIRDWFAWFLDDEVHLHRRKILRHTVPGQTGIGTATQAHYDLLYLRGGTDRVLSMWIPLGDVPLERGGLCYLEASHVPVMAEETAAEAANLRPARSMTPDLPTLAEKYDTRWLVTDYDAGDVVVHSAHLIHAALDNVDSHGRLRLSTDIRYQRVSDPIDWRWDHHWHDQDGL